MNLNAICIGINSLSSNESARFRSLALDFTSTLQPFDPRITYSGDSARMRFDSTGTLQYAPMNLIRNNTMVGAVAGSPGTTPTNWVTSTVAGNISSKEVVGVGVENGIAYIDYRYVFSGAATGVVQVEAGTQIVASAGQTWAQSTYVKLVGGSLTNMQCRLITAEATAAGAFLVATTTNFTPTDAALNTQRVTATRTLTDGTTARVYGAIFMDASGAADITLRIGMPQLQLGSEATPVIPTSTAAVYLPRSNAYQDHGPSTLTPLGFLIEEARTNSIRNNTMQGAAVGVIGAGGALPTNWGSNFSGLTLEVVSITPSAGINKIRLKVSGTTGGTFGSLYSEPSNQIAAVNAQVWTNSLFAARVAGTFTNVTALQNNVAIADAGGVFLANLSSSDLTGTLPTTLTRISTTQTLNNASVAFIRGGLLFSWSAGVAVDFTLDIGLPQLELGAFATSPILTSGAAATRLADSASITGSAFASIWNQTDGTVVARHSRPTSSSSGFPRIFQADDGTNNNTISLFWSNSLSTLRPYVVVSGVEQATLAFSSLSQTGSYVTAFGYKESDFAASNNGGSPIVDLTGTLPTTNIFQIGHFLGSSSLNGHIQSLTIYRKRLSNTQIQSLTA